MSPCMQLVSQMCPGGATHVGGMSGYRSFLILRCTLGVRVLQLTTRQNLLVAALAGQGCGTDAQRLSEDAPSPPDVNTGDIWSI